MVRMHGRLTTYLVIFVPMPHSWHAWGQAQPIPACSASPLPACKVLILNPAAVQGVRAARPDKAARRRIRKGLEEQAAKAGGDAAQLREELFGQDDTGVAWHVAAVLGNVDCAADFAVGMLCTAWHLVHGLE